MSLDGQQSIVRKAKPEAILGKACSFWSLKVAQLVLSVAKAAFRLLSMSMPCHNCCCEEEWGCMYTSQHNHLSKDGLQRS